MSAQGSTFKRCGCLDGEGKPIGKDCPRLRSAAHGSWYLAIDLPTPDGRRKQRRRGGFASKQAATVALAELCRQVGLGVDVQRGGMTVAEWLDEWISSRARLRASTRRGYQGHIDLHLAPAVGHLRLSDLRASHLSALYGQMIAENPTRRLAGKREIGPATVGRVHATIRAALSVARKQGLVTMNVATLVELPETTRPPVRVWLPADAAAFLDHLDATEDRLAGLFVVTLACGLRRGEVVGLRWMDIDLGSGHLRVTQAVGVVGYRLVVTAPKTKGSARTVALDADTVARLRTHRRRQQEDRLRWGSAWVDSGLAFTREDGSMLHPETVSNRFETITRAAALPKIRFHDLRHTSASIGLASGETLVEVRDRLGHSSIVITADTYTHVSPAVATTSAERRAALVKGSSQRVVPIPFPSGVATDH